MRRIYFILLITIFSSCFRLDDNIFNPSQLDAYRLDQYTGEVDFQLPDIYDIPEDNVHLFTIHREVSGESFNIHTIYIGDTNTISSDTVILYFHGNRDHMDFYWPRAELLANAGGKLHYSLLMFELPGFGLDGQQAEEDMMYKYSDVVLQWLKEKGLTGDRLISYGISLGSAPATFTAGGNSILYDSAPLIASALILEAPFASVEVLVQDAALMNVPAIYVTDVKISVAEYIKQVQAPLLWMHGVDDMFLNIETNGEVVFKNYSGVRGEAVRVVGADHGSVPQSIGFPQYLSFIEQFLSI